MSPGTTGLDYRHRAIRLCAVMLIASACGKEQNGAVRRTVQDSAVRASPAQDGAGPTRRVFGDTSAALWKTQWSLDGNAAKSGLLYPIAVAATPSGVYVLDAASGRVTKYTAANGTRRWVYPDTASGQRLQDAAAMTIDANDNVLILERKPGRVVVVTQDGSLLRQITLPRGMEASSFCVRADGSLLLATSANDAPLVTVDSNESVLQRTTLPWPAIADQPRIVRQFRLAGSRIDDHCALTLSLGMGFVDANTVASAQTRDYVESFALPPARVTLDSTRSRIHRVEEILDHRSATRAGTIDAGSLLLAFEGQTPLRGRLIDIYAWPSGSYQRSLVFPSRVTGVSRVGDLYFILTERKGAPALIAARHP